MGPTEPSDITRRRLAEAAAALPADDRQDFRDATRGLIAPLPDDGRIPSPGGGDAWDVSSWSWVAQDQVGHRALTDSVHPALVRQTRLLMIHGLFEVCEGVYQVRSADLANMTIIEGDTGVILVDPLTAPVTARAALELYTTHRGVRPVHAVIHTHSHIDHYGGVRGVVTDEDVATGRVQIIAPEGFAEAAISENVLAGNVMTRRASYMYGALLPKGPLGTVGSGLGLGIPLAATSFMMPTVEITEPVQSMTLDGVEITFMLAPDTEAPAEMLFHLPQRRALCSAEDATHTLHNLYTLRGARTRDAKAWSFYLDRAIELFGDVSDVVFAQHHWPTWGRERVIDFLEAQRDVYLYLHDQTLRLANHGETMLEIAEQLELPPDIGEHWCNRSYYGSVSHNAKAVYNLYLGWFDANPSTLHQLPPADAAARYVEYMGGAEAIKERVRADIDAGEYRWSAQVLNHVVFADPGDTEAREMLAGVLEQLGYVSENAVWRNFYLTGAQELRTGTPRLGSRSVADVDTLEAMPLDMLLSWMAVRLNGPRARGHRIRVQLDLDQGRTLHLVELSRSVLHHWADRRVEDVDATIKGTASAFKALVASGQLLDDVIRPATDGGSDSGLVVDGDLDAVRTLLGLLDDFQTWFPIIEP